MRSFLYPLLTLGLFGADWPQFRGPNASGLCPSCGRLPAEFGPQKNVLWKTALPPGKSSPVLAGNRDAVVEIKALLAGAGARDHAAQEAAERAAQVRRIRDLAGLGE